MGCVCGHVVLAHCCGRASSLAADAEGGQAVLTTPEPTANAHAPSGTTLEPWDVSTATVTAAVSTATVAAAVAAARRHRRRQYKSTGV